MLVCCQIHGLDKSVISQLLINADSSVGMAEKINFFGM